MKSVTLCNRMPHDNSYVGGVVSILLSYLKSAKYFEDHGFELNLFNYEFSQRIHIKNAKLKNILYIFRQRKALSKRLKQDNDTILNIHTSREFLFLKDVFLAKLAWKKHCVPVVLTVHVGDISTVFNRIQPLKELLIKYMNRYISKTVFLSKEIMAQFVAEGLDADKCEVLYNFHNLEPIAENEELPRTAQLHLLYVGAIHREKGVIELLTALNQLQTLDWHLDLCGKLTDSSIQGEYSSLISSLRNKVTEHGYVSGKKKTAIFERADALILPSYHEGMPLVVLEALAGGCAVISTKVGATPEILTEDNVCWVEEKSAEDLSKTIQKLYVSQDKLKRLKDNNLALSGEYGIEEHIAKLCKIYESVNNNGTYLRKEGKNKNTN